MPSVSQPDPWLSRAREGSGRRRILHIITGLGIGGAERMLLRLCTSTQGAVDHRIISLVDDAPLSGEFQSMGVPVQRLGVSPRDLLRSALMLPRATTAMMRQVRSWWPDVIQGWMYHGNLMATGASVLSGGLPHLWNIRHSVYDIRHEAKLTRSLIRVSARVSGLPRRIIYNSRVSSAQHEALGYASARHLVIPNGFDVRAFRPSPAARTEVRAELGVAPDALLVGIIGRLDPAKDHTTFFRAAASVCAALPDVHFVAAGLGLTRDSKHARDMVERSGARNVHMLGIRHDVPRIAAALDVAVSSSMTEGFPNAVGEAMSCGVPCVVTDVGDSAYLVGRTGIVVQPSNPGQLAAGILSVLEQTPESRRAMGLAARTRIQESFQLDAIAGAYLELYEQVSRSSPSA